MLIFNTRCSSHIATFHTRLTTEFDCLEVKEACHGTDPLASSDFLASAKSLKYAGGFPFARTSYRMYRMFLGIHDNNSNKTIDRTAIILYIYARVIGQRGD